MAIPNAERQALHRERERNKKTIMQQLVIRTRSDIREWKRTIALIESGVMRMSWDGQDASEARIIHLNKIISENQYLVDQFDPAGELVDGDIEMGEVPSILVARIWDGRFVSYALDAKGRACDLKIYEDARAARAEAASVTGRYYGTIGAEGWSIKPAGTPS